jgi:uncharacterized membrane protein
MRGLISYLIAVVIVTAAFGADSPSCAQPSPALLQKAKEAAAMSAIAEQTGSIRIIVEFTPLLRGDEMRPEPAVLDRVKAYVRSTQDEILIRHFGSASSPRQAAGFDRNLKRATISPMFSINVTKAEMEALAADPQVLFINQDVADPLNLVNSVPMIGMNNPNGGAYAKGATGAGQAVAILDTGVQTSHPFITASKVIAEACFSTTESIGNATSLCRNGVPNETGPGSGANCTGAEGCFHGTHVAGIAAGFNTSLNSPGGGPNYGVAKDAKIISIQVFSLVNNLQRCGSLANTPCVLSYRTDQILALDWLFENSPLFGVKVAAANMSLGGGQYFTNCDNDQDAIGTKASIDRLKSQLIATVIATGNDSFTGSIGKPACISSAVRVSSSTKDDHVSVFSNMATMVDLLAPGGATYDGKPEDILSSAPINQYIRASGTSMAAPHVTGAIAALRSVYPMASVQQLVDVLAATGRPIKDDRDGGSITKPRIQVDRALTALGPPVLNVTPAIDVSITGDMNGPFFPATVEYVLEAPYGSVDFDISIAATLPWLQASPASGTVNAGSPVKVTLKVAPGGMAPGKTSATITFKNKTNDQGTTTRKANLMIAAASDETFHGLNPLEGYKAAYAGAMSADGQSIAGSNCLADLTNCQPMQWYHGFSFKARSVDGYPTGDALAVANNGANLVGTLVKAPGSFRRRDDTNTRGRQTQAFVSSTGAGGLGFLPGHDQSEATGVSSDGGVIVGYSYHTSITGSQRAVQWTRGSIQQLPLLGGELGDAYAYGVNRDGSVIVGSDQGQAMLWIDKGTKVRALGFLQPDHKFSRAQGVSGDGAVPIGFSRRDNNFGDDMAVRWFNGGIQGLGVLPGASDSIAYAANSDGSVIVGSSGEAFRWTAAKGMQSIKSLATAAGYDLSRWRLTVARGVSADGTVIAGRGYYYPDETGKGIESVWLVRLRLP